MLFKLSALGLLFLCESTFALSPFNGTFCGRGIVTVRQNGEKGHYLGTKILVIETKADALIISLNRVNFDDKTYLDVLPEHYDIRDGRIFNRETDIGNISDTEINVSKVVSDFLITFNIQAEGNNSVSYNRLSSQQDTDLRLQHRFSELTLNTNCENKPPTQQSHDLFMSPYTFILEN